MLLNLLVSVAFAGKLADGLFGVPWAEAPTAPPKEACRPQANGWVCPAVVADIPVDVTYAVEHGVLHSVFVNGRGMAECEKVRATYDAAWGEPVPTRAYRTTWMDDHLWQDGGVVALWQFNRYSGLCVILAQHLPNADTVQAAKRAAAARATEGL